MARREPLNRVNRQTPVRDAGASRSPEPSAPPALRRLAWLLDDAFRIPGTDLRFGIDPLLGLIPGGGDVAGGALSAWIVVSAARLGAPPAVLIRMAGNVLLEIIVGVVPLIGDLFDAGWKANRRNVALLQQFVAAPSAVHRHSRILVGLILLGLAGALAGAIYVSYLLIRWIVSAF